MDFNLIYKEVLPIISFNLSKSKIRTVCPDDLINDAYIKCIESGVEVTKENLIRLSNSVLFNEQIDNKLKYRREFASTSSRTCNKCGESKPGAFFRIETIKNYRFVRNTCLDCERERNKVYQKKWIEQHKNDIEYILKQQTYNIKRRAYKVKMRKDPEFKKKEAERRKEYMSKEVNKARHREYMRERMRKKRSLLWQD